MKNDYAVGYRICDEHTFFPPSGPSKDMHSSFHLVLVPALKTGQTLQASENEMNAPQSIRFGKRASLCIHHSRLVSRRTELGRS